MKIVLRIIGVVLVVLIGAVILANYHLGAVIKTVAESAGPKATGGAVKVEQIKFALLRGKITISGLVIGNPEGFKTDSALELRQVDIDFEPRSLLSDTIHIRSMLIEKPRVTFEGSFSSSNLSALLKNVKKFSGGAKESRAEKPAKKVIIDEIILKGGLVNASFIFTGRIWEAVPTPLPPITLKGVGQDKGGVSSAEVFVQVIGAVLATVTGVIKGSANPLGEGVKRLDDGATAVGKGALEAGEAVGGAAVKGAGEVVETMGQGAGKVIKGLDGLLGGKKKDE
jgi:hypothetical protein